jgi:hypothetical protein
VNWYRKAQDDENEDLLGDITRQVVYEGVYEERRKIADQVLEGIVDSVAKITMGDGSAARCKRVRDLVDTKVVIEGVLDQDGFVDVTTLWWASKMITICCLATWANKTVVKLINDLRGFRYRAMLILYADGYIHDKESYRFAWLTMLQLNDRLGKKFNDIDAVELYEMIKAEFDKTGGKL